jgi:uncharacterized protein YacL
MTDEQKIVTEKAKESHPALFSPGMVGMLADEITRTMMHRLPQILPKSRKRPQKKAKKFEHALLLDTSAIIDRRMLDVMRLGLISGTVLVTEGVLRELKHIADSQDTVRRERGRKGLDALASIKKLRFLKVVVLDDGANMQTGKKQEVDELLITVAKKYKCSLVTCDYNLEKKAAIQNIRAINVNVLANALKVTAVPGEAVHINILHQGKDPSQGVGYLDDGTMVVVSDGSSSVGKTIDVVIARVIQTVTGRILFAKRI